MEYEKTVTVCRGCAPLSVWRPLSKGSPGLKDVRTYQGDPFIASQGIVADQKGHAHEREVDEQGYPLKVPSVFDPDLHKKYHAKYYFQKDSGQPIADAERTPQALRAYNEFLEGLEQINCQEYLKEDFLGEARGGKSGEGFIGGIEKQQNVSMTDVHDFAKWTRYVRTRSSAHTAQQFSKKLKTRAQIGILRDPSTCKSDMIPIRGETAALLTRPLEMDFSLIAALTYVVQIVIYAYALYVQINSITGVCSGSYMCPFQTKSSGLPVLAPPILYRDGVSSTVQLVDGGTLYQSKYNPWQPTVKESCILGEPGCDTPGYLIQWPYIEVDASANDVEFPQELIDKGCYKVSGGEVGWVFDPFLAGGGDVRDEYWNCSGVGVVPGSEASGQDPIPFLSRHTSLNSSSSESTSGTTTFHFSQALYKSSWNATLSCMKQVLSNPDYGGGTRTHADWNSREHFDATERTDMRQELISCLAGTSLDDNSQCQCDQHNWVEWALGLYWPGSSPTKTCKRGPDDGAVCVTGGDVFDDGDEALSLAGCRAGASDGRCEMHFDDQVPLNRNWKYGCWFTSPLSSSQQLNVDYYPCGLSYTTSNQYATSATLLLLKKSIDLVISKRTLLILVFLIKESSILTAICVVPPIAVVLLLLLIFLYYVLILPIKLLLNVCGMKMDFTLNSIVVAVKAVIFVQLRILWTMCINFSTSYRIVRMGLALFRGLVNPSLRDLDVKLTTVANTVFSLVLLIALADGTLDPSIVISLCLSLLQLLYAMNTEKVRLLGLAEPFKDLNENRLSKFEIALMLTKVMEDLLEEDVQYNWVQHFNSDEPMKAFDVTFPDTLGSSDYNFEKSFLNQESLERKKNFEERFDDLLFPIIHEDPNSLIKQQWLAPFPAKLLKKFGHDGQAYDAADANPDTPKGKTVQWKDTGRKYEGKDRIVTVELMPEWSDMRLLGLNMARDATAVSSEFFSQPLFSAGHADEGGEGGSGGPAARSGMYSIPHRGHGADTSMASVPPGSPAQERDGVQYSHMASSRTPVSTSSVVRLGGVDEESAGPEIV